MFVCIWQLVLCTTFLLYTFRLLTKLRLGLSHLHERKFKHSFQDCLNPLCFSGNEIETSTHYLLHCPTYTNERMTLLSNIKSINCSISLQLDSNSEPLSS